jgi:hypothetical protein
MREKMTILYEYAPSTSGNLQTYTKCVFPTMHGPRPVGSLLNDGKLPPAYYGSILDLDLGLYYKRFELLNPVVTEAVFGDVTVS